LNCKNKAVSVVEVLFFCDTQLQIAILILTNYVKSAELLCIRILALVWRLLLIMHQIRTSGLYQTVE